MSPDADLPDAPMPPSPDGGAILAADQVAAHATEPAHGHGPFHEKCENCATPLAGPFCHRCGQHDFEFHRSFWHVFLEILENFFHFDAKLFQNTITLLFRPGRLTAAFNAGRRVAQMPPFRLYLFVSVLFFFLLFLENTQSRVPVGDQVRSNLTSTVNGRPVSTIEALQAATGSAADHAETDPTPVAPETVPERKVDQLRHLAEQIQTEAAQEHAADPASAQKTDFERRLTELLHRSTEPAHQRAMVEHFLHAIPKLLLLCLPLFALYTRFLFRKSGQVYLQHLVLALHFHTFIYLWMMFRDGWVFIVGLPGWGLGPWLQGACALWLWLYPFLMFRHLFANSWPKTVLKTVFLFIAYFFTLTIVMFASAIIIFFLL